MRDDTLEIAILETFLRNTDFTYLDELVCIAIPEGDIGRTEADRMLRWHGLYKAIRAEFPNLSFGLKTMQVIWETWDSAYGGPLMGGPEYATSGWYSGIRAAIAAGVLGKEGHVEPVLVAGVMLCHGYNSFGGDVRPLIDGYRYLLPAITSFTSATTDVAFTSLDIPPGWFDSEGSGPNWIKPNPLTRALNLSISDEQRRLWISREGRPQAYKGTSEEAWLFDFGAAASLLDMDISWLTENERTETTEENDGAVASIMDGDELTEEDLPLETYHTAYVVAANTDRLMSDAIGVQVADKTDMTALFAKHLWLSQWANWSWRYPACWPEGSWRDAIAVSPLDWFIHQSELPPD